jgi:hypothetical protein
MDDYPSSNKWGGRGRMSRDISIVVDDEYEDQDVLTRSRGGGNPLANSMLEIGQDQGFGGKSRLQSTRNRARNSTNLDM